MALLSSRLGQAWFRKQHLGHGRGHPVMSRPKALPLRLPNHPRRELKSRSSGNSNQEPLRRKEPGRSFGGGSWLPRLDSTSMTRAAWVDMQVTFESIAMYVVILALDEARHQLPWRGSGPMLKSAEDRPTTVRVVPWSPL